jgi:hypothetical protein
MDRQSASNVHMDAFMTSLTCPDESTNFADRLYSALLAAGQPVGPTAFARAYNALSGEAAVSVHAARKWLNGEAIPTHQKVVVLARWLNVQPWWLCFGGPENELSYKETRGGPTLSRSNSKLIHDVMALSAPSQTIIRDIVNAFMRVQGDESGNVIKRRRP